MCIVFSTIHSNSTSKEAEVFELALGSTGLSPENVVHIGDSLSSDIEGVASVGIPAIWVNRSGRDVPEGVCAVGNLLEAVVW